jgi:hypothetical protein
MSMSMVDGIGQARRPVRVGFFEIILEKRLSCVKIMD